MKDKCAGNSATFVNEYYFEDKKTYQGVSFPVGQYSQVLYRNDTSMQRSKYGMQTFLV